MSFLKSTGLGRLGAVEPHIANGFYRWPEGAIREWHCLVIRYHNMVDDTTYELESV